MQVILLERVQNLGELGDAVKVKPGFARNFLIPQGKAVLATPENLAEFERRRKELEQREAEALAAARERAAAIEGREITIARKSGEEGRLFGSVGTQDIADALTEAGVAVERQEVRLPGESLRQVGEYTVDIHLFADVDAQVTVHVVPES